MRPTFRNIRLCFTTSAIVAIQLAAGCSSPPPVQGDASAANLVVNVSFTAKWWSNAQMEGLNPNNPPPKDTEVRLTRWEYTDPIGVPHPDTVDALVTINNRAEVGSNEVTATVEGEWNIGPLDDKSAATWDKRTVLAKTDRFQVPATSTHTIRVPVDLKAIMDDLERARRWPHALRITVTVDEVGGAPSIARAQVEFPILRGD